MIEQLQNDKWFVDVRGDVRGPLSSWQILQDLMAGNLKVIHRASRDRSHWKGICNEEHFYDAIELAIQYQSSKASKPSEDTGAGVDDEKSGFLNLDSVSKGISDQLNHAQDLQEINVSLNSLRKLKAEMLHNKKTVIEAKIEVEDEVHPDDRHVYVSMDTGGKTSVLRRNKFLFSVLFIGIFVLGTLKILEFREKLAQESLAEELKALQMEKALEGYEQVIGGAGELSAAQLLSLAEQEIEKDNLDMGTKLLTRVMDIAEFGPDKSKAQTLLGYIATQEKDLQKAALAYEKSVSGGSQAYLALHNYGLLRLRMNQSEEAEALLIKAMGTKDGPKDRAPSVFALVEVALVLDKKINEENKVKAKGKAKKEFKDVFPRTDKARALFGKVNSTYAREEALLELFVNIQRGAKSLNKRKVLEFLKVDDSVLEKRAKKIPGQDIQRISWSHLYSWCLPVYSHDPKSVQLNALFSYCVWKSRGAKAALPYIQFAAQKANHDPIYKKYLKLIQNDLKSDAKATKSASTGG